MKFFQIQSGQRFYFKGESYTKTGPLTGSHDTSGENKSFRRADAVQTEFSEPDKGVGPNHQDGLMQEFEIFYSDLIADLIPQLEKLSSADRRSIVKTLDTHRKKFERKMSS